jgi:hypothetical protein
MSATIDIEAMSPQDRARYERKREHEFYRSVLTEAKSRTSAERPS